MANNLRSYLNPGEMVLWEGKPNKKCFILESIFNPLLPFAIIWAAVDLFAISGMLGEFSELGGMGFAIIGFFFIHLMPVWLYIGGVVFSFLRHKNIQFLITDRGVYVSGGLFSYSFEMKPFTSLSNISIHQGVFDRLIKVGDVVFTTNEMSTVRRNGVVMPNRLAIINIPDYEKVYKMVKQLQIDVYSDTMYPNDLRPSSNHGYKTDYTDKNNF